MFGCNVKFFNCPGKINLFIKTLYNKLKIFTFDIFKVFYCIILIPGIVHLPRITFHGCNAPRKKELIHCFYIVYSSLLHRFLLSFFFALLHFYPTSFLPTSFFVHFFFCPTSFLPYFFFAHFFFAHFFFCPTSFFALLHFCPTSFLPYFFFIIYNNSGRVISSDHFSEIHSK